jgi:hypothetical protein
MLFYKLREVREPDAHGLLELLQLFLRVFRVLFDFLCNGLFHLSHQISLPLFDVLAQVLSDLGSFCLLKYLSDFVYALAVAERDFSTDLSQHDLDDSYFLCYHVCPNTLCKVLLENILVGSEGSSSDD